MSLIQYNTIQYNTIQYNTIQYNTIQYNTIQYNTIQYNTIDLRKERLLQSRVSFLGFPTPEQGDKFKTLVAHTLLIKAEFSTRVNRIESGRATIDLFPQCFSSSYKNSISTCKSSSQVLHQNFRAQTAALLSGLCPPPPPVLMEHLAFVQSGITNVIPKNQLLSPEPVSIFTEIRNSYSFLSSDHWSHCKKLCDG